MEAVLNTKKFNIEEDEKTSGKFVTFIKESYYKLYKSFANNKFLGCIKSTVILLLPVIILGFLGLIISLITSSSKDASEFYNTPFYQFTIGIFTVYFTIVLTYKYMKDKITSFPVMLVVLITNVLSVLFLTSLSNGDNDSLFSCGFEYILFGIFYSYVSVKVFTRFLKKKTKAYKIYTTEAQKTAILIGRLSIPLAIILIPTALISFWISQIGDTNFLYTLTEPIRFLLENCSIKLLNGIIYTLFDSGTSFVGLDVSKSLSSSIEPELFNTTFMNLFIKIPLIFGFVLAVIIFGRKKQEKIYGGVSMIPSTFAYPSGVFYGFPMFLNPLTLIPVLVTPIITFLVAYFMCSGLNINIDSTYNTDLTLIIYNAYEGSNSGMAMLVQAICIGISFVSFIPFVFLHDYAKSRAFKENIKELYPRYLEAKARRKSVTIFDFDFELGETAKILAKQMIKDIELMNDVRQKVIDLNSKRESYHKAKEFELGKRELLNKLKKSLKIKSYFQPIVGNHVEFDLEGNPTTFEIKGMECLMRYWYNDSYIIPPLALEIARTCGLEYEINSYLWENMLINVDRKKSKSFITFNISMSCLENEHFVDDILTLFERYDMDPSGFVIEITEEDEFDNEAVALEKICTLKEKGFYFAIDDYGAGQTSMKYFQTNAFELVKIDGDLIKKAKENEQVYDIIGNIKDLGKRTQKYANIQFKVLCEFIEDKESFDRLAKLKVDYYQGYLFGKAMDFDDVVKLDMMVKTGSVKHV